MGIYTANIEKGVCEIIKDDIHSFTDRPSRSPGDTARQTADDPVLF